MTDFYSTSEEKERVLLLGVSRSERDDTEASLRELGALLETAGAESVGAVIQSREAPDPGTYFGTGKLDEVREKLWETGATAAAADDELSPAQMRNLKEALGVKIMDRTMVILDIFARHAVTSEGKIQVEMAQLKYTAAHLEGLRSSLSRLGGGIGTRGPGEQKLELDRRVIHERIGVLKHRLTEMERHRNVLRKAREKSGVFTAAVVGYTNAGKSTLLNCLTGADILAADALFATLDPTTRHLTLPGGEEMLLTDTVGFIRKLPHHLIEAFHSTLEEAVYSDLILHVVDVSNPEADVQVAAVYDTLAGLGMPGEREIITVLNKIDAAPDSIRFRDPNASRVVRISAKTGEGIPELLAVLEKCLRARRRLLETVIPYARAGEIQVLRKSGRLMKEEYRQDGIYVMAEVPADLYGRFSGRYTGTASE